MSGLSTLSYLMAFLAAPAMAETTAPNPQLQFFANCTGRLSALMEHQWNHDTAAVDTTVAQRKAMITLITAVMPPDAGRDVLAMRINAKYAQSALLQRAIRSKDPVDAAWANNRATALLDDCTSILLSHR